ncbi:MAG TPA: TonB-dependent receptor [Candidatus Didemnitutus sp.]|nr:TonB-dependent receptor [Candidatus Didemnitutus sp.]
MQTFISSLCFAVLCAAAPWSVRAQNSITVSGMVRDSRLQPIVRATVQQKGTQRGAYTDARGWFRLAIAGGDTVRISISCVGYKSQDREFSAGDSVLDISIILEESSALSQGIVVTSFRANEQDPVTQTTVTRETMDQLYIGQDPQYILERTVPSVISYSESGTAVANYGTFRIRGIDQTRVNVTLDGTPINDMIDQGVFFSNMSDLSNGMRSIQVQRGTGMSSNGTASYAGSVNFDGATLTNTDPSAELQLSGGSFNLLRGSAAVSTGRMESDVSVYARFTTLRTDGYRNHTGSTTNSLYATAAWFGVNDVIKLSYVWGSSQNELGYYPVTKPLADTDPKTNLNDSTDTDDFGQQLLQLQHSHAFSSGSTITTSLYYGRAGGDFFSGYRDENSTLVQINYPLQNKHLGVMSALEVVDVVDGLDASVGIHAYTFERRNWEYVSPESARPYYDDRTTKNELSGTLRARYRGDSWEAYADMQVRSITMMFTPDERSVGSGVEIPNSTWFFINPRFGLRYDVATNANVYASFGRTGREPTRFDLLGSTQINQANLAVVQNPGTVRPEFVNDVELGARFQASYGYLVVNVFAMFFTDEIAPIGPYIEQQFVQLRKNVPTSSRRGIEIEGSVLLISDQLWLDLNGTVMQGTVDEYRPENLGFDTVYTNVRPVLTPELQANAALRFRPVEPLEIHLAARYVGESYTDLTNTPSVVIPSFTQVDARLWWNFVGKHRVGVMANNLFDAFVVTNGGSAMAEGVLVPTYFVQATRNFVVMLDIRF